MKEIIVKDGSLFVMPNSATKAEQTISEILTIAKNSRATDITINLSKLNMFDALKIATLTAAHGLTQNRNNRFEVIVANEVTKSQIKLLSLQNLNVMVLDSVKTAAPKLKLLAVEV